VTAAGPATLLTHAGVPEVLRPDPGRARSWVEEELSRREYHVSPVDRFLSWIGELWDRLTGAAQGAGPLPTAVLVLGATLLVVAVLLLLSRVRRDPRRGPDAAGSGLGTGTATPDDHRRAAEEALRRGAFDLAVVEGYRALAGRAVRRGLLDERPGLTAHELAADLRPRFPDHALALERSADLFDLVFYGARPATAAHARGVLDLETALREARPVREPRADGTPAAAVPR
jgi:hypothetical protein